MNKYSHLSDVALVVDDSADTLGLLKEALEAAGIDVLLALDGQQALGIAQKIVPDVILLDAMMPNMDGFEACRRLKAEPSLADIPVIFMTGLSDTESVIKGLEVGGVDYLSKPVNPDELVARLRVHLGNARRANSARQALDRTGQHLISLSPDGELRWTTEQARQLLDRTGLDSHQCKVQIYSNIVEWLSHQPLKDQILKLSTLDHPLHVQLVSDSLLENELVFKLIDPSMESTAATLREALAVTERESDVLFWIAQSKTNREIGEILSLSPRTIDKHLETIFRKLSVENRTAAAAIAIRVLKP